MTPRGEVKEVFLDHLQVGIKAGGSFCQFRLADDQGPAHQGAKRTQMI
jgi:hypothetical protein